MFVVFVLHEYVNIVLQRTRKIIEDERRGSITSNVSSIQSTSFILSALEEIEEGELTFYSVLYKKIGI